MEQIKFIGQTNKSPEKNSCCSGQLQNQEPLLWEPITGQSPSILLKNVISDQSPSRKIQAVENNIVQVDHTWQRSDYLGAVKSRISAFRMQYRVNPGLYALGKPDTKSEVFISANYKLSFDMLRASLKGINGWLLVLDTKGINVWCAAGKGTFGTKELIRQIQKSSLDQVVSHKHIIVPQLGAVGVNAREVQKTTGFRIFFGPVEARDIPAYLEARYRATPAMRKVRFSMLDRMILTPMEIVPAFKKSPLIILALLAIFGMTPQGIMFHQAMVQGSPMVGLLFLSVFSGAFLTPVLLPYIPFRAFAIKGWLTGVAFTALAIFTLPWQTSQSPILWLASLIFFPLLSSYTALQFTGATTYTGMSGVKKELKIAVPIYFSGLAISIILIVIYKLMEWSVL